MEINRKLLWPNEECSAYALLDGASCSVLLDKLYDDAAPEFACLFAGDLEPDMAEVAPYIARLEPDSDFASWVMSGWGEHWGIYAVVPAELDLATVRRHLRKLNMVYGPDNQPLFLSLVRPACDAHGAADLRCWAVAGDVRSGAALRCRR